MKKKSLILMVFVLLIAVLAVGCTSKDSQVAATTPAEVTVEATVAAAATETPAAEATVAAGQLSLTLDELKAYDGKNGNPAYVAVDGVIYDVTNVKGWNNGSHQGYTAGTDLTDVISKAPHRTSVLKNLTVVGAIKAN